MANFAVTPTDTTFTVQVGENTLAAANSATAAAASAASVAASAGAIQQHSEQLGTEALSLVDMAAASANVENYASWGFPAFARPFARRITRIKTTGSGSITIQVSQPGATANTATALIDPVSVAVTSGDWVTLAAPIVFPANAVTWVRIESGASLKFVSGTIPDGGEQWFAVSGDIGTNTAYDVSTIVGIQVEFEFEGEIAAASADAVQALSTMGETGVIGFTSPIVNTGETTPETFAVILPPADDWTLVTGVRVGQAAAGVGNFFVVTLDGLGVDVIHSAQSVAVQAGVNLIPIRAAIPSGAQVVWQSAVRFQINGGGGGSLFINGPVTVGATAASNPHRMEFNVEVASGLTADVLALAGVTSETPLPLRPNDPWCRAFGYRAILEQSATALQGERAVAAGLEYRASNPGAGLTFRTNSRWLDVQGLFNKVAVRDDAAFDDFAEVLVDGVTVSTWTGSATAQRPRRVVNRATLGVAQTMRTVEVVCPYGDGFVIEALGIEAGADVESAAAAPAAIIAGVGDSITHGYSTTKPSAGWLWRLGKAMTRRVLNMGIGGQIANAAHIEDAATAVAADGANATILWMIGVNNCLQQLPVADYKAQLASGITLARADAPSAKIVLIAPPWCPNAEALTIPLDSYRTAMQEAVAETAAGNVHFVNAKPAYANDSVDIDDGIHPQDIKNATLATWLSTRV